MVKKARVRALLVMAVFCSLAVSKDVDFNGQLIHNQNYVNRGPRSMRMDVFLPKGRTDHAPMVLVIHGGGFLGGTRKQMIPLCLAIARRGMIVFNLEYRLAPWSKFPAQTNDARCALRYISRHASDFNGDPKRIGVIGESAGAYLSSMTFLPPPDAYDSEPCADGDPQTPPVAAAVLYYGVYDLAKAEQYDFPFIKQMFYLATGTTPDKDPELYRRHSPITYLHPGLPPILLIAGDRDPLYPETLDLYNALTAMNEPVEMKIYPGASHAFAIELDDPPGPQNLDFAAEFLFEKLNR